MGGAQYLRQGRTRSITPSLHAALVATPQNGQTTAALAGGIAGVGGLLKALTPLLLDVLVGVVAGSLTLLGVLAAGAVRIAWKGQRQR